jgi:hypothetical protein
MLDKVDTYCHWRRDIEVFSPREKEAKLGPRNRTSWA